MASYLVMMPPEGASNPDSVRFVRDGFSFSAFLLPLVWMLWHRMWLYALLLFLLEALIAALAADFEASAALFVVQLTLSLLVGLESGALRTAWLRSRGWTLVAAFSAGSLDDAEESYFSSATMPAAPQRPLAAALPAGGSATAPTLGLFDYGKGF